MIIRFITIGGEAIGLKPISNTFAGYPGFPRPAEAGKPLATGVEPLW